MRRLLLALLVLAAGTVVVRGQVPCDVVSVQPDCYVALLPGPTGDTSEMVSIEGTTTYPTSGKLLMTTVQVDTELDLFEFVRGAFADEVNTVRRDVLYPEGETPEDVATRNAILMENSQLTAALAGLEAAGYELDDQPHGAQIVEVVEGGAVDDELQADDVVVQVAGRDVATADDAVAAVQEFAPGDEISVMFLRGGTEHTVELTVAENPDVSGSPFLGLLLRDYFELPVDVTIDAGRIGGPSAGLMFALGIVELLGEEDLTGGRVIAGTGTIDRDGVVGPIGGIRQKVVGAVTEDEPADVFLVPADNFGEAQAAPVDQEILLVPVATVSEALEALRTLRSGQEPAGAVALGP